jgi:tight adherence protein B
VGAGVIGLVALLAASVAALRLARRASVSAIARRRLPMAVIETDRRSTWLDAALEDAALPLDAAALRRWWAVAATVLVVGAIAAGGLLLAVVVALLSAGAVPIALRLGRGRRDRLVEAAMPDALDAMARSLRSGGSLRHAIEEAARDDTGPLAVDLRHVAADLHDGASLVDALDRWALDRPLPGVRLAAAALALGAETGGATAQAVDGVAETLRTNVAIAGEVRALSSQARMSALVIALAPIGFTFLAATSDGSTATFLLRTPAGVACLCAGLALDLAGGLWMRKLTAIVV